MSKNRIGSIPYGLNLRPVNPGNTESEKRIYACAQSRETISLRMLAKHIREHGSTFSVGTLYGVLTDMVACTLELLKSGYSVNFEGLARFYVTLHGKGVEVAEDFNAATDILKVCIRADVEEEATSFMNTNPEFEYATTRGEQAAAKAAAKLALTSTVGSDTTSGGDTGGNGPSGNDTGNGGDTPGDDGGDVTE